MTDVSSRAAPPAAPVTLFQAEEGSVKADTATEVEAEQRRKAEAKERIETGGAAVVFGFSTLLGCLWFPNDAKHAENNVLRFISLFLAFCTFVSGNGLMLLSINMLGLRRDLVSSSQYVAAKCLVVSCVAFSVLTLLSLMALPRRRLYLYIGLAVVTVVLPPAAGVHWYLRRQPRHTGGSDEAAHDDEHKEELEAASKITSCITNSAFGGLVGVLFSASKISGVAADAVNRAAYVAIFFMFATAILGMFLMTVSKKVPGITNPRFRRLFVTAIRLANALLLCSFACAAFAAAFVVLRYRVLAAFSPLVTSGIIRFLLRHCVVPRGAAAAAGEGNNQQAERLKAIEDLASKVTTATFGGIMSVLGGSIGENDNRKQAGATDVFMVVLTSAFVSGFGFMLLAAAPGSARARLADPAAKVLVWSSVALFATTAVAVYGLEVWTL